MCGKKNEGWRKGKKKGLILFPRCFQFRGGQEAVAARHAETPGGYRLSSSRKTLFPAFRESERGERMVRLDPRRWRRMRGAGMDEEEATEPMQSGMRARSRVEVRERPSASLWLVFSLFPRSARSSSTHRKTKINKYKTHHHVVRGPDVDSHPVENLQARALCERREGRNRSGGSRREGGGGRCLFLGRDIVEGSRDGNGRRKRAERAQAADVVADHRSRRLALRDLKKGVDLFFINKDLHREEYGREREGRDGCYLFLLKRQHSRSPRKTR